LTTSPLLLTGDHANFPAQVRSPANGQKANFETFGQGLQDLTDRTSHTDTRLAYPAEPGAVLTAEQDIASGIWFWVKRRGWMSPDIDLTGTIDARAAIEAAGASRPGACVYIPDGIVRLGSTLNVPNGCTITGDERGMRAGDRVFAGAVPIGTRFDIKHTGVGFNLTNQECSVQNVGIYYPDQVVNATPTFYDYTFSVTGIGCHLSNVTAVNPYKFLKVAANGFRADNLYAFPLNRGITLGRCPDVVRISNCHFIPITNYQHGATLLAYVQANAKFYVIDGAEAFQFTDCFSYGGLVGVLFWDEDADGFKGSSGSWKGGSIDLHGDCVRVETTHGLSATGCSFYGTSFVTVDQGRCVLGNDNQAIGSDQDRPAIYLTDCHGNSAGPNGMARFVWLLSTSKTNVRVSGGTVLNIFNELGKNDSADATLLMDGVMSQWGKTRTSGAGEIRDVRGRLMSSITTTGSAWNGVAYKTGQTASITATNLFPGDGKPPAGPYNVAIDMLCTTASGSGAPTLQVTIAFTDQLGATSTNTSTLSLAATGRLHATIPIACNGTSVVTYAATIASASGSPQYSVRVTVTPA
jgi:hypothetical protein